MKPDFKNININAIPKSHIKADYKPDWETVEHINVKPVYTAEDLEGMEHLNYAAGIAPYLRGPYSTMYVMRPSQNSISFSPVALMPYATELHSAATPQTPVDKYTPPLSHAGKHAPPNVT